MVGGFSSMKVNRFLIDVSPESRGWCLRIFESHGAVKIAIPHFAPWGHENYNPVTP